MANKVMELATEWLTKTVDSGKTEVRKAWNELSADKQMVVVESLQDLASLRLREAAGQNVGPSIAITQATLKNMGVVVQLLLYRTFLEVLNDSLKHAGTAVSGMVEQLLSKLTK